MKPRLILAILINLVAIAVPGAVLYLQYGPSAAVNPGSVRDMMYLLGTAFFSFTLGLGSAMLLRSGDRPALLVFLEDLLLARGANHHG